MSPPKNLPEVDWSKIRVGNVYLDTLSPEERKKYEAFLTPEKLDELKRSAVREDQDKTYWHAEGDKIDAQRMKEGMPSHSAIATLRRLARRQGFSDDEMMARSGLDRERLVSMKGRDAKPSLETMEAYAKALGKKLLIVLADEDRDADGVRESTDKAEPKA